MYLIKGSLIVSNKVLTFERKATNKRDLIHKLSTVIANIGNAKRFSVITVDDYRYNFERWHGDWWCVTTNQPATDLLSIFNQLLVRS